MRKHHVAHFSDEKQGCGGLPGGPGGENLPANAGAMGSVPGPEASHMPWNNGAQSATAMSRSSRACMPQLLSPRAETAEAPSPNSLCSAIWGSTAMRTPCIPTESRPCQPQPDKACVQH